MTLLNSAHISLTYYRIQPTHLPKKMGAASSKGRIEIDVERQAWVRNRRPNPAHPKHQGLKRNQSAAGSRPQFSRHGDEGRSYHDDGGLRRAQTTRSQNRSGQTFLDDDSDDGAGGVPPRGNRHERPSHHDSRDPSRGQVGGRGMSHAQSNSRHGGPSQQGHDFAPPADHMRPQHGASGSQRGSQHDSHRGSQQRSQGR